MTEEDEEFNRIEREAKQRMEAVAAAIAVPARPASEEDTKVYRAIADNYRKDLAAAQREWVGLTPHERMMCRSYDIDTAIEKTEAKLKEKNGM
jgi:ketosteroid isomerase-like protein